MNTQFIVVAGIHDLLNIPFKLWPGVNNADKDENGVAELERENIQVQTMAGRWQKAREGKWNGGQAPYG